MWVWSMEVTSAGSEGLNSKRWAALNAKARARVGGAEPTGGYNAVWAGLVRRGLGQKVGLEREGGVK